MRGIFSLVGILLALAIVGVLVKKQMGTESVATPGSGAAAAASAAGVSVPTTTPGATAQEQSLQIQQQVKQSVEATLQTPRGEPTQ